MPKEQQGIQRRKRLEAWIDAGHGSCILQNPAVARMTQESFLHFDGIRYRLLAWAVMPNHIHVLIDQINGWTLNRIVATWKKRTASQIRHLHPDYPLPVWHREFWDRFIRDEQHLKDAIEYDEENPVKAGLCKKASDWRWSSAYVRNNTNMNSLEDQDMCGPPLDV